MPSTEEGALLQKVIIHGDQARLEQVLRNFLSNALKFTPEGGTITVSVSVLHDSYHSKDGTMHLDQELLRINVADSGPGIAPANLPRIFNEIVQFNAGKLQKGGGSGFGLWITKSIMDLHHGRVSVHSEGEGTGCTFTVDIPATLGSEPLGTYDTILSSEDKDDVKDNKESRQELSIRSFQSQDDAEKNLSQIPILVVDDSHINRKMISRSLATKYANIGESLDGADALSKIKASMESHHVDEKTTYQVVLMDHQMPNMDGPTAAKEMRALGYKGLIIGITGNALPEDINVFLSHGANKVLSKPVSIAVLDRTINGKL